MKILLVTPRFYPEPFTITRIAEELASKGHDITVLTGRPNYGKWSIYPGYENVREEDHNGIHIIRVKERIRKKGVVGLTRNYASIYSLYQKALKKMSGDYDIVFSHVMSPIFVMNGISRFCEKYHIPHFHYGFDLWPESLVAAGYFKRNSPVFKYVKKMSIANYSGCDQIAFASPSAEKYFTDYLKIKVNFKHIYQPCLTTMPDISFVSNHAYIPDGKIHVLFCGTIAQFNHLDLMIEALDSDVFKANVIFDIVGSGSDKERIEKIVKEKSLEDVVVFHGRVAPEETKNFYKKADILFVPLYYNSATSLMIPQKLIEYFMYSRPIFGMIKGDGADLLKKASDLNVVSDQTIESLRDNLKKIIEMPTEELQKCGSDNRHFIETYDCFSLKTICDDIEKCLIDLVEKTRNNRL